MKKFIPLLSLSLLLPLLGGATVDSQDKEVIHKVEAYLNSLQTYEASFEQFSAEEGVAEGKFYLERPRRFLWLYASPEKQKLVSTGQHLYFHDIETEQTTQLPLNSGIAAFLTQKEIAFKKAGEIKTAEETPFTFNVVVALPEDEGGLEVGLIFQKDPIKLSKMITRDAFGSTVFVTFDQIKQGHPLDETLFDFVSPFEEIPD